MVGFVEELGTWMENHDGNETHEKIAASISTLM
jgi:hypothetical protein